MCYELTTLQTVLIKIKATTYEILGQTAVFGTMQLQGAIIEAKILVCFLWILLVYLHWYWFFGAQRNPELEWLDLHSVQTKSDRQIQLLKP